MNFALSPRCYLFRATSLPFQSVGCVTVGFGRNRSFVSSTCSARSFSPRSLLSPFFSHQTRFLHLHEGHSMALLREYDVSCAVGCMASTTRAAEHCAEWLGVDMDYVVKAQVLAGGRGLGFFKENDFHGGVHICTSAKQVKEMSVKMLGNHLVTKQTGEQGKPCDSVFVCERFYLRKEKYVAILMDRLTGGPLLIGSAVGGTSIEDIAVRHPESIHRLPINISNGLSETDVRDFCSKLGFLDQNSSKSPYGSPLVQAVRNIEGLYKIFIEKDCTLVEINPFAETHDGRVIACDAKLNFDDNASFRQEDIFELRDVEIGRAHV